MFMPTSLFFFGGLRRDSALRVQGGCAVLCPLRLGLGAVVLSVAFICPNITSRLL